MAPDGTGSKQYTTEPIKRLERLLICAGLFFGYSLLFVYQDKLGLGIPSLSLPELLAIPTVALLVIPLVRYCLVRADPLQRSASRSKAVRFFQGEFPSLYLLHRCQRCAEDSSSCPNYIAEPSLAHRRYWFQDVFHGPLKQEDPDNVRDTFEKGYTCKLVYGFMWILRIYAAIAVIVLIAHVVETRLLGLGVYSLTPLQLLFPAVCLAALVLLGLMHRPDLRTPTGCWHAWREINRMHVEWMRQHEPYLVDLVCHSGRGTKTFRER
jgi:hypothetical protein